MPRILISGVLLLLAILVGALLLWPNYQKLNNLWLQLERKETDLRYTEEYYKELSLLSERLKEFETELLKIDSALPSQPSLPSFYNFLQKTASENGLILTAIGDFSTAPFKGKKEVKETSVGPIGVAGSYSSLKNFLIALEENSRMIKVESLSFSAPKEGEIFDFKIALKIYSY